MDQPKIERVLRLMQLLSGSRRYTIEELAKREMTMMEDGKWLLDTEVCGMVGVKSFELTVAGAKIVGSEELGMRS